MGKHDRENTSNGAWPKDKPLPQEAPLDRKDKGGKHTDDRDDDNEET